MLPAKNFQGFSNPEALYISSVWISCLQTLRSEASESDKEEFVKEAKLMSQFDNDNIVKLLGVCIDKEPYYLLLELMNKGDLVGFLRKSRPTRVSEVMFWRI